jgi:hypothetical protein
LGCQFGHYVLGVKHDEKRNESFSRLRGLLQCTRYTYFTITDQA